MDERSRAIHKAAGVLDAAYFVHARADTFRARGWNKQIVEILDGVADDLKGYAVAIRQKADAKHLTERKTV